MKQSRSGGIDAFSLGQLMKIRARRRFKGIVRLVIRNLYWLRGESHQMKGQKLHLVDKRSETERLTVDEKRILNTPPEFRTEEEINLLEKVIGDLKCFRMYSKDVKRALAAHTMYAYFPPNRIMVRQGAPPWAMYVVLTGQLEIKVTQYVDKLDEETVMEVGERRAGSVFGDSSLLYDTTRSATIRTLTHSEFLVIRKVDFDRILKDLTMERWQEILAAVDSLPYFKNADFLMRRDLCVMSHLQQYKRKDVILGDGIGRDTHAYFIIKGTCKIIEHVPVKVSSSTYGKERLYKQGEEQALSHFNVLERSSQDTGSRRSDESDQYTFYCYKYPRNVKVHFMEICTMLPQSVFNIGEQFERRRVVAASAVTCLSVPTYWLIPRDNLWDFIRVHMDKILPDSKAVFKMYQDDKKWKKFKKAYIGSLIKNKPTCNNIHNVPYSIRIMEDDYVHY